MCGYGWRGLRYGFCGCGGPREAMLTPYPFVPRPRREEKVSYLEEYKKDLEQELADVAERLKILKKQG